MFDTKRPMLVDLDDKFTGLDELIRTLQNSEFIIVEELVDNKIRWTFAPQILVESRVESASAVALTNNTGANVTSITLGPGKWEITGLVGYQPVGGVNVDYIGQGASSLTAQLPTTHGDYTISYIKGIIAVRPQLLIAPRRVTLTDAETTIYLVAQANFSGGTSLSAFGWISAKKVP